MKRLAVCDNPTCPARGIIIEAPAEGGRRCDVCAWLMRVLKEADEPPALEGS